MFYQIEHLIDIYGRKLIRQFERDHDAFPHYTEAGIWKSMRRPFWTAGFWVGQYWWMWHYTKNPIFRTIATHYQGLLHGEKNERLIDSDLGMMYFHSFALGYCLTDDAEFEAGALLTANYLLELTHPPTGLIMHNDRERAAHYGSSQASTIIDVMMNLRLLWWAYEQSHNDGFFQAAKNHAFRSLNWLVRDDGSTAQVVDFDFGTGEFLRCDTNQGFAPSSCWSRGQAWAIYGFLLAYHHTEEQVFLNCVHNLLSYWQSNIPTDFIPYWDFIAPVETSTIRDSSAAAIVCAALAQLHRWDVSISGIDTTLLLQSTLSSLAENYLQPESDDGVLAHGCLHYPAGRGVKEALVVGDYFLLEALAGY